MSYWNCDNPRDHKRQGERDFDRNGAYGYDSRKYNDHWDDCNKAYRDGFDEARREQERRDELDREREEREAQERRRLHEQHEREEQWRMQEEEESRQRQEEYEAECEAAEKEATP